MKSLRMKTVIGAVGAGAVVLASAAVGFAVVPNSLPAGTKVTAALASGTVMTFQGDINGVAVTVDCTSFSGSGIVPAGTPYKMNLSAPPTISGCSVSGFSATIKTNSTNGKWSLKVTKTAPYTLTLIMPEKGAVFTSALVPGCKITAGPTKAVKIKGSYDGTNTDTVTNAPIPVSASGCTSSPTSSTSATVVFTPSPGTPPF